MEYRITGKQGEDIGGTGTDLMQAVESLVSMMSLEEDKVFTLSCDSEELFTGSAAMAAELIRLAGKSLMVAMTVDEGGNTARVDGGAEDLARFISENGYELMGLRGEESPLQGMPRGCGLALEFTNGHGKVLGVFFRTDND